MGLRTRTALDVETLYERNGDAVLRFLVRRTADVEVALDLCAETFAQALESRERFRGSSEAEARAWLYRIASRQVAYYYRRGQARRRALERLRNQPPVATEPVCEEIERRAGLNILREELATALLELSEPVRRAVQLRVVQEFSYPDVAAALEISERVARTRVSRGLKALAQLLDETTIKEATGT